MIHPLHLRRYVIEPTLKHLALSSEAAVVLLLGTAATESGCGRYLRQLGGGPARGIYQMEPATHESIWRDFLIYRPADLQTRIRALIAPAFGPVEQLDWNLGYATAMARMRYYWAKPPLPAAEDLGSLAAYWKTHYNTPVGAGTIEQFVGDYQRYIEQV